MTTRANSLGGYPLVIEPTVEVLEVKLGDTDRPDQESQAVLHRVPTHVVLAALELPGGIVHFFGASPDLDENDALLCYSTSGRLTHVMRRGDREWTLNTVPAETTGEPILKPSVRLVFTEERHRAVFLHHMRQIIEGKSHHPSMALLLEQLAEPIRVVDVWSPKS